MYAKASINLSNQFTLIDPIPQSSFDVVVGMAIYYGDRLEWIEQAVNSVITQSYTNFVFAVVFDGEVAPTIKKYLAELSASDSRILLIEGEQNLGLSACMNFIIDWALSYKPLFFFRMDADDISEPSRLTKQVAFLQDNLEISVLGSALMEVNESGKVVGQRKLPLEHENILKFMPKRCSINHPTVAIRFSVFEQGFRYNEQLRNTQDYFLWADLLEAGFKFANLSEQLIRFRRVNDFYKRRALSKSFNEFKARWYTMMSLKKHTLGNVFYALAVLGLRLMPPPVIKLAYKFDRMILEKVVKH